MQLIQKVKRRIRISSNKCSGLNDSERLLENKRYKKIRHPSRRRKYDRKYYAYEECADEDDNLDCSITASLSSCSSSLFFDDLDDSHEDNLLVSKSLPNTSLPSLEKKESLVVVCKPDITSSEESSTSNVCSNSALTPYKNVFEEHVSFPPIVQGNKDIMTLTEDDSFNAFDSSNGKIEFPSSSNCDKTTLQVHSSLEVLNDFDRFVNFCSDKIDTLCESPVSKKCFSTSFFNVGVTNKMNVKEKRIIVSNDDVPDESSSSTQEEKRIIPYKSSPTHAEIESNATITGNKPSSQLPFCTSLDSLKRAPVDAIADNDGLIHIFHDKLSTLYESGDDECDTDLENNIPSRNNRRDSSSEDEDIIKARWAYAVEMMNLDGRCGIDEVSLGYEVAEI